MFGLGHRKCNLPEIRFEQANKTEQRSCNRVTFDRSLLQQPIHSPAWMLLCPTHYTPWSISKHNSVQQLLLVRPPLFLIVLPLLRTIAPQFPCPVALTWLLVSALASFGIAQKFPLPSRFNSHCVCLPSPWSVPPSPFASNPPSSKALALTAAAIRLLPRLLPMSGPCSFVLLQL